MDIAVLIDGIAVSVAVFAILHNAWVIGNISWARRWLLWSRQLSLPETPETFAVLLLPMLNEQGVVQATINDFLADYPEDLYRVIVVTSARECTLEGEATGEAVERVVATRQSAQLLHFRADGTDTTKADQLNQALHWLDVTGPSWWTTEVVVGVYQC